MGSCSNKSKEDQNDAIKVVTKENVKITLETSQKTGFKAVEKTSKQKAEDSPIKEPKPKYTIEITDETTKRRQKSKKLTILSTNDDIQIVSENPSEFSLVRKKSIGKSEQGSFLVLKKPAVFGGIISKKTQNEFEEKVMNIEGNVKKDYLLENRI